MKKQADKHRSERQFLVGDWVFVKLQPYVQSSLVPRANQKLAFKYFGPYQVTARIGSIAYKLDLPATSSVHPVFHVSQLKKAITGTVEVTPLILSDLDSPRVPERILQRRVSNQGTDPISQVLIK